MIYAAVYLGFAATKTATAPWVLLGVYGLYQALAEDVSKALVAEVAPKEQRAGAIGLFYTLTGMGQLGASVAAGALWKMRLGPHPVGAYFTPLPPHTADLCTKLLIP